MVHVEKWHHLFYSLLSHWDGIYCAMGWGRFQGAGFYESSYSKMLGMDYGTHPTLSYVECDRDPHSRYPQGVTMPWGDSRLDILSLEVSCAPPMWHSSLLPIFSWAKGSSGAASWRTDIYTFMNVNRQADISICALRTQHRSLEGLPRQKIEKRIHILSFIDPQPIVLKVDMALFPLKSIFYDITCYCNYIVFESIF